MPNWCDNTLTLTLPSKKASDKLEEILKKNDGFFKHYKPLPESLYTNGWYDWCVTHWGTKWDVTIDDYASKHDGKVYSTEIYFQSAWAPPIQFYRYLEQIYGFKAEATYIEEGMEFVGSYENLTDTSYRFEDAPQWLKDEYSEIFKEYENETVN
tara:strand:+ start:14167 stop:14628 length:462 start_codon:yes stop_codon:yes gene_type:complete